MFNLLSGKMIKKIIISLFIVLNTASISAQDASIKLWADQQVFIAGEDMWVDGMLQHAKAVSRTMHVQLLDRNGNKKAETIVLMDGDQFNAYISIPNNLASDYYFLDGYNDGLKSKTALFPVMIINPKSAPSLGCSFISNKSASVSSQINIYSDKESYQPRADVKLTLSGLTNISKGYISVVRNDLLSKVYEEASIGFYVEANHNENTQVDDEGKMFTATVSKNGKPAIAVPVVASLKGSPAVLSIANSNQQGELRFLFPFKYDATEIVLHPLNNEKGFSFESTVPKPVGTINFPCLKLDEKLKEDIEARMMHLNVIKQFYADMNRTIKNNVIDTTDFYGKPDARYYLDEYVRFPNMEEVLAEIISEVRVKKEKDAVMLQVLNIPFKFFFNNEGLILVDGVPFFNTKELLESDPLMIKSIDVVNRKYIMGDHEFDGIVHFKTYRNDMGSMRLSDLDKSFSVNGLQKNTTLKPAFAVGNTTKMPDMRNTAFKKNDIQSDFRGSATMEFKLSDAVGNYSIIFRGIDKEGKTTVVSKNIAVVR
jgi:hypothetical protein